MIRSSDDDDAQFICKVDEIENRFQARWEAVVVATDPARSETDVRMFDRAADAWAWIDEAAKIRGFARQQNFGPDNRK